MLRQEGDVFLLHCGDDDLAGVRSTGVVMSGEEGKEGNEGKMGRTKGTGARTELSEVEGEGTAEVDRFVSVTILLALADAAKAVGYTAWAPTIASAKRRILSSLLAFIST